MNQVDADGEISPSRSPLGASRLPAKLCMVVIAWPLLLLGALVGLLGVFLLYGNISEYSRAYESEKWPIASGFVTKSFSFWQHIDEDTTDPRDPGQTEAQIFYSYEVGGHSYTGSNFSFDDRDWDVVGHDEKGFIRSIIQQYPPGKKIEVHYNPNRADESVLKAGAKFAPDTESFFNVCLALGVFAVGVFLSIIGWLIHKWCRSLFSKVRPDLRPLRPEV